MITKDISLLPHKARFILIEYPAACCMGALFDDINRPKYFKPDLPNSLGAQV